MTTSRGPRLQADRHLAKTLLTGRDWERERFYGVRASLHPYVKELDLDWDGDPQRRPEIVRLVGEVVLRSDVPQNMAAAALVTNACLYTGEEKYRQWVLDYVEAWMERVRKNRGIMPDNVGPTGVTGENRGGQWWGGYYGWNSRFSPRIMLNGAIVGAECALLLSGDYSFLEVLRSQLRLLFDNAVSDAAGQLLLPHRYGPGGWHHFRRFRIVDAAHLWHASMERRDCELIERLRAGDRQGGLEPARLLRGEEQPRGGLRVLALPVLRRPQPRVAGPGDAGESSATCGTPRRRSAPTAATSRPSSKRT